MSGVEEEITSILSRENLFWKDFELAKHYDNVYKRCPSCYKDVDFHDWCYDNKTCNDCCETCNEY